MSSKFSKEFTEDCLKGNVLGTEIVSTEIKVDADTEVGAINRLFLNFGTIITAEDSATQEKSEIDIWTEVDSIAVVGNVKDKILVPSPPPLISRSPTWIKSKIKDHTLSSDFASVHYYEKSAEVGKIDISSTTEAEIDVTRIRKEENSAYIGSSFDFYRQSELNSRRTNSGKSPLTTPRIRSGPGTPTIVEGIEENEIENGSNDTILEMMIENIAGHHEELVDKKKYMKKKISHIVGQHDELGDGRNVPKHFLDGFLITTSPDTPPKSDMKGIESQIQRLESAKRLMTPSPLNLSPITPSSVSPVRFARARSVKDLVTRIQQKGRLPMEISPIKPSFLKQTSPMKHGCEDNDKNYGHPSKNERRIDIVKNNVANRTLVFNGPSIKALNNESEKLIRAPSNQTELLQNINAQLKHLPLKTIRIPFLKNKDLERPFSFKSDPALEVQITFKGIQRDETENGSNKIMKNNNKISHILEHDEELVDKKKIPKHSLDGFLIMTSPNTPPNTCVKKNAGQIQRQANTKSPIITQVSSSIPPALVSLVDRPKSVKDIIGNWGIKTKLPEKVKETTDFNSISRRISDRWTPLRKDVIEKDVIKERPESSRVKGMVGTWGALATKASYKKRDSEIIVGKLNNRT